MLRRCDEHGPFRGDECLICGSSGKFLMNDEELERLGRIMAGILRHFPDRYQLNMDTKGWVEIRAMVDAIRRRRREFHWLRPHHVEALALSDLKGRYQVQDGYVRATYGHSIDVEPDLPTDDIPDILFYPISEEEAEIVLETGLKPSDRRMVHLSLTPEAAYEAGSHRMESPMIISVDAKALMDSGGVIMRAGTTVFTTREVPAEMLSVYEGQMELPVPEETEATDDGATEKSEREG